MQAVLIGVCLEQWRKVGPALNKQNKAEKKTTKRQSAVLLLNEKRGRWISTSWMFAFVKGVVVLILSRYLKAHKFKVYQVYFRGGYRSRFLIFLKVHGTSCPKALLIKTLWHGWPSGQRR